MQAVVFADRNGAELAPLCDNTCPALLHLGNRPVLQHTIENLAVAGVDQVFLVVSDDVDKAREQFGDGAMWGLKIRYLLSRGEEHPTALLKRYRRQLQVPFLVLRGDIFHTASSSGFLALANDIDADIIDARIEDQLVGMALVKNIDADLGSLAWPLPQEMDRTRANVNFGHGLIEKLDSLKSFYEAALSLMQCDHCRQSPPGLEITPGLFVGRSSDVIAANRAEGTVLVGDNTWIHSTSRISGPSSIGHDCYIDRGVEIHRSIVMPGTYIGEELTVSDSIVAGDTLLRMDTGTRITLREQQLLAPTVSAVRERTQRWAQQLAAVLLLMASLPLWPLALIASWWRSPGSPWYSTSLQVNRSPGSPAPRRQRVWLFATRTPLLRHLPMLWLAARGQLLLFGARPLAGAPFGLISHPHGAVAAPLKYGLLGPAQLYLPRLATEEEIQLSEIEFAARDNTRHFFARLLRAGRLLFSTRAWRPVTAAPGER